MNAQTKIEPALPPEPFDAARDKVNALRGRCMDAFARAEEAVTETLLVMAETERGKAIRLQHLVGQRFDELNTALGEGGAFAGEGKAASATLAAFRQHDDLRAFLCHGVAKVTLDKHGRWTVVMRVLALRARKAARTHRAMEQDEVAQLADQLAKASRKLCSQLGDLQAKVRSKWLCL
ncbi:hypothetical protein [Sphingomonas colocasiae]|uniref:PA2169 family four-helix-bundle protein n=1 Tax=Sphingomonas colocasiae TaxID=1848973 RepID=A0ABS7PTX2_9SPHN|nr:hypothetical protein [Sphingomonas colocasiae]MBY8823847.1 hypothetical protein [Sphingomonas colocasiae]